MTQQATLTHGRARLRGNLVDVKHVTKQKRGIWKTRSNGTMENVVVQDESVLCSSCHKTVLYPERLMHDRTMDTGRTGPVRDGATRWRWMVTRREPRAFFRVQRTLQAILGMTCYITDTDATQLLNSLGRSSERLRATVQQQNIWRVQE